MPALFAGPSPIAASAAVYAASIDACCAGISFVRVTR
jgi:hypothetical protein